MAKHFDIIVVGCGPTGAIASLLLAQKGLQVAIVEQHQNVYPHPRAIALNGFSMGLIKELLQDLWGVFEFTTAVEVGYVLSKDCLLYTSPSPRDQSGSRMPSSA